MFPVLHYPSFLCHPKSLHSLAKQPPQLLLITHEDALSPVWAPCASARFAPLVPILIYGRAAGRLPKEERGKVLTQAWQAPSHVCGSRLSLVAG